MISNRSHLLRRQAGRSQRGLGARGLRRPGRLLGARRLFGAGRLAGLGALARHVLRGDERVGVDQTLSGGGQGVSALDARADVLSGGGLEEAILHDA